MLYHFFNGGDVTKNSDFIEGKMVVLYQFLNGGDVTKNSDFLLEKMVVHGQFFTYKVKAM